MSEAQTLIEHSVARLLAVKALGDGVLSQVSDEQLFARNDEGANSIAILVQHLHGNMMSRWTDLLTSDGNKPWRKRDAEFEPVVEDGDEIRRLWDEGWKLCLDTVGALRPEQVMQEIVIRGQALTVMEGVLRQLSHYNYHVGQMVLLARQQLGDDWQTLSIARGQSGEYKPQERAGGIRE